MSPSKPYNFCLKSFFSSSLVFEIFTWWFQNGTPGILDKITIILYCRKIDFEADFYYIFILEASHKKGAKFTFQKIEVDPDSYFLDYFISCLKIKS